MTEKKTFFLEKTEKNYINGKKNIINGKIFKVYYHVYIQNTEKGKKKLLTEKKSTENWKKKLLTEKKNKKTEKKNMPMLNIAVNNIKNYWNF